MPLDILLLLVIGGLGAIALLLHLSGRSEQRVLDDDSARSEWLRHFPEHEVREVVLSRNRHAAPLRLDAGVRRVSLAALGAALHVCVQLLCV